MSTTAVTREHTQLPAATPEKPSAIPLTERGGLIPLHCVQSNSLFPIKQVRSLDMLHGSTESPPEIPHNSRRTLMSPQECEISRGSPNQTRFSPNPLHWLQNNSLFPIIHDKWLTSFRQLPKFPERHVFSL